MRLFVLALVATTFLAAFPLTGQAQWGYSTNSYPGLYGPPLRGSAAYIGPYGYRSYYNFNGYPTPFGYGTTSSFGAWQQPYQVGPYHSVYFNPYLNTYQYGTGYLNTPMYWYSYGY